MKKIFFGEFLVRMKLVSYEDLWEGLNYQRAHKKPLGAICIDHGVLNPEQVIKAMNNQRAKSFGEFAIKRGYLTERQLQVMLIRQENQGLSIGKILTMQGKVSAAKVKEAFNEYIQIIRSMKMSKRD